MWCVFPAMFGATPDAASHIKTDEVVVFFPTCGRLDKETDTWMLPIHGWIYEPEEDSLKRAAALGLFRRALGLDEHKAETAVFKDRARLFLVDNERGKRVQLRFGPAATIPGISPNPDSFTCVNYYDGHDPRHRPHRDAGCAVRGRRIRP
jgi:hypothetical protein